MGVDYACNVIISVSDFYKDDLDYLLKDLQEYAEKERDSALGKKIKRIRFMELLFYQFES